VPHPLLDKFARLRRRLTWLQVGRATGWAVAAICGAGLLLAALDYFFRYHDRGLRYLQTAALLAAVVLAVRRWAAPLRRRPPATRLAQAVSERFALPADQLTSALEFLSAQEAPADSLALCRSVIHDAWAQVEPLDFQAAVDARPCRIGLGVGGAVLLAVLLIGVTRPAIAWAGVERLLLPWSNRAWPRQHELEFRNLPTKAARGQALSAQVADRRGRLPERVTIHLEYDSGDTESLPLTTKGESATFEIPVARESFWIWAEGGDDRMPADHRVEVVEPPRASDVQVTLHPPEYLGLTPSDSPRALRAVAGTRVDLAGKSDRPLSAAFVVLDDGTRIPLTVDAAGRSFRAARGPEDGWTLATSGTYRLELTDTDDVLGLEDDDWAMQVLPDELPVTRLEVRGTPTYVTPEAVLDLNAAAEDDWALQDLFVEAQLAAATGTAETTPLPGEMWPPESHSDAEIPPAAPFQGDWSGQLPVSSLPGATPGATLSLAAVAHDRRPGEGRSAARKLSIVSREEFLARFEEEVGKTLADLRRIVALQETAQQRLAGLSESSKRVSESLTSVARDQATIRRQLIEGSPSVIEQARRLTGLLTANGLEQDEAGRRLGEVIQSLTTLDQGLLPNLAADTAALARQATLDPATFRTSQAAEIRGRQQAVLDALGPLVGVLQGWELLQQLAAQLAAVAEEQRVVALSTSELAATLLGRPREQLTPVEVALLEQRLADQRRLARRFALLEQRLAALSGEVLSSDTPLLERLAAALAQSANLEIGVDMQQAMVELEANRMSLAATLQRQAADDIDQVVDTLRGVAPPRADSELDSLSEVQSRQADLAEQMAAASEQQLAALAQRQADLAQSVRNIASSLSSAAAKAAAAAHESMTAAEKAARAGDRQKAADAAKSAAEQLQTAADSAMSPEDAVAQLRERALQLRDAQQRLLQRTSGAKPADAPPLARDQAQLRGQAEGLSQRSGNAPVVQHALGQVSQLMSRAVDLLEQGDAGAATQRAQAEVVDRLTQLADSLAPQMPEPGNEQSPQTPQQAGEQEQQETPAPPSDPLLLAELKLVRQWQQTIQERFAKLAAEGNADQASLQALRDEQAALAKLATEVAQRAAEFTADAPQNPNAQGKP